MRRPQKLVQAASQGGASESQRALRELIDALSDLDQKWIHTPGRMRSPFDESDGYRNLMHLLEDSLVRSFEADPEWPVFQRMVTPTRKYLGDNPDAIYLSAFVRGGRRYRIRGNLAGSVYTSFTLEYGDEPGAMSKGVASVLNDSQFEVSSDGSYQILVSPNAEPGHRGWLELPPNAVQITTRHYFERERSAAADPSIQIPLVIEPLDDPKPPPTFDDGGVARGIRRVVGQLRAKASMSQVAGAKNLTGLGRQRAERVPEARIAWRHRLHRARRIVHDGALRPRAGRSAGDDRAFPEVPLRQRRALERVSDDLRLRPPTIVPQSQADDARVGRTVPDGPGTRRSGCTQLDRHGRASVGDGILALLPARGAT